MLSAVWGAAVALVTSMASHVVEPGQAVFDALRLSFSIGALVGGVVIGLIHFATTDSRTSRPLAAGLGLSAGIAGCLAGGVAVAVGSLVGSSPFSPGVLSEAVFGTVAYLLLLLPVWCALSFTVAQVLLVKFRREIDPA